MSRVIRFFVAVLASAMLSPLVAQGGPVTQDLCQGSAKTLSTWKSFGTANLLENLLFAYDSLWISDSGGGRVVRLGPDGAEQDAVAGPTGGLAVGPDGLIYAGNGNSIPDSLLRRGLSSVVRFNESDPTGTLETYAEGFDMANGFAFAPNGDLYVSNDVGYGPIVIPRDDPSAWHELVHLWGTNGLVVDPAGENLYAAITFDQRSPIERIPLSDPTKHETAASTTFGVLSLEPAVYTDPDPSKPLAGVKGLDDMTRSDDGTLYVVATGTGELLRVDPVTGESCNVEVGFQNPSSVRIAPKGSAFDTSGEALTFYITEWSGDIRTVGYTPAP
jgi:sugar lactone lactonase YvrE